MAKDRPKIVPAATPPLAGPATPMPAAASGSLINKVILFFISLLCVFVVYKLNEGFFDGRIAPYWEAYGEQKDELDLEQRKLQRWGGSYYYSKGIADYFGERGDAKKVLVLMPPSDYFTANGMDYYVPEPSIFYYMTGLKTSWSNHGDSTVAKWYSQKESLYPTWYVHAAGGQMMIDSVQSRQQLDSILTAFNQYKTKL